MWRELSAFSFTRFMPVPTRIYIPCHLIKFLVCTTALILISIDYCARFCGQKQIQRDSDLEQRYQRERNASRSPEQIRGESEYQHMHQSNRQESSTLYSDQQESRGMAGQLHDSNGILDNDRIRNTIIENHRRTTAAITGTTKAVETATAEFRSDARQNYPSLVSTIKDNGERAERLSANTKVISDNTDAISRTGKKYSDLYRADQWQSQRDEPNYNELRGRTGENLNRTAFSLVTSSQSTAEFARNIRDIEANIIQMKERQKEMDKPQPKQDRGMSWGI